MYNLQQRSLAYILLVSQLITSCQNHILEPNKPAHIFSEPLTADPISKSRAIELDFLREQQHRDLDSLADKHTTFELELPNEKPDSVASHVLKSVGRIVSQDNSIALPKPQKLPEPTPRISYNEPRELHAPLASSAFSEASKGLSPKKMGQEQSSLTNIQARGGHAVTLVVQNNALIAEIDENTPPGFSRQLRVPVYGDKELLNMAVINHRLQQDSQWGKRHIEVIFPEKDPTNKQGYVFITKGGLMGGGNDFVKGFHQSEGNPTSIGVPEDYSKTFDFNGGKIYADLKIFCRNEQWIARAKYAPFARPQSSNYDLTTFSKDKIAYVPIRCNRSNLTHQEFAKCRITLNYTDRAFDYSQDRELISNLSSEPQGSNWRWDGIIGAAIGGMYASAGLKTITSINYVEVELSDEALEEIRQEEEEREQRRVARERWQREEAERRQREEERKCEEERIRIEQEKAYLIKKEQLSGHIGALVSKLVRLSDSNTLLVGLLNSIMKAWLNNYDLGTKLQQKRARNEELQQSINMLQGTNSLNSIQTLSPFDSLLKTAAQRKQQARNMQGNIESVVHVRQKTIDTLIQRLRLWNEQQAISNHEQTNNNVNSTAKELDLLSQSLQQEEQFYHQQQTEALKFQEDLEQKLAQKEKDHRELAQLEKELNQRREAFFKAIQVGHLIEVKRLYSLGLNLASTNQGGYTAIQWAVIHGHVDIAKYLIHALQINPKIVASLGNSLLHLAASAGHLPMVKYLIEELQVDPHVTNQRNETPLDCSIQQDRQEIVAYFFQRLALIALKNPTTNAHLRLMLNKELGPQLKEIIGDSNLDDQASLTNYILQEIENSMQGVHSSITTDTTSTTDPDIQRQVDELLAGIGEGLQQAGLAGIFDIQQLRPQATRLVKLLQESRQEKEILMKEIKVAEKELAALHQETTQAQQEANKQLANVQAIQGNIQDGMKQHAAPQGQHSGKNVSPKIMQSNMAVYAGKQIFVPTSRSVQVKAIRGHMDRLQQKMQQAASMHVDAQASKQSEIQKIIQHIYQAIDKQQKELMPLYRDLKRVAERRAGDKWILEVDASKISSDKQKSLEEEVLHMKRRFDYPDVAKKLLQELQAYQQGLDQILAARNETWSDYGHASNHRADFENDYSSQELADYMATYGTDAPPIQQDKDQAFIGGVHVLLKKVAAAIWKQVGSSASLNASEVKQLLQQFPQIRQYITVYSPLVRSIGSQHQTLVHISELVIRASWMALGSPLYLFMQPQTMNAIKKQVHRLRLAIQAFIQQPAHHFLTQG